MPIGAVETVTKAIEGVDTVVIVEENICNKNKRKDLLGLISTLQKAYKKEGEELRGMMLHVMVHLMQD